MNDLGVDFGTSNTVAALTADDAPARALAINGHPWMPSAVCLDEDNRLTVGIEAERLGRHLPEKFEPNPKRRIDEGDLMLGLKLVRVVDALTAVLTQVAAEARRQLGGRLPDHVCLTHPAQWGPVRQQSLRVAAQQAGLAATALDIRLIPEPVAAATHYLTRAGRRLAPGKVLAVYDLGGGTFDVALVGGGDDGLYVLASAGLPDLGGVDFDQSVLEHLGRYLEESDQQRWRSLIEAKTAGDRRALRALRADVRAAKELLSQTSQVDIPLPDPLPDALLTRREFEKIIRPSIDRTVDILTATLEQAGVAPSALAGVYLVGGSSRIPLIAKVISERLGIIPVAFDQPETVVALGAAVLAATGMPDLTTSGAVRPTDGPSGEAPAEEPLPSPPHEETAGPAEAARPQASSGTTEAPRPEPTPGTTEAADLALLALADQLSHTNIDGAAHAYRTVIEHRHPEHAPRAAVSLGNTLRGQDFQGARDAFQFAIDSQHPYYSSRAAIELGTLLLPYDTAGANRAYRSAIDAGHVDLAPEAAIHLGAMLSRLDPGAATAAYRQAIESGHRDLAPRAAFDLGTMLSAADRTGAIAAFQLAVDTGHPDWAPVAGYHKAVLQRQVDRAGAEESYRRVMATGHAEYAPMAANDLGLMLWISDPDAAAEALKVSAESGHPQWAPLSAVHLGNLLATKDPASAAEAYRIAVASGHPEHAPLAALNLGLLLQTSDPAAAVTSLRNALESRHREVAPTAAYHLGQLLRLTDPREAMQAYRFAADSGHPTFAPLARRDMSSIPHSALRRRVVPGQSEPPAAPPQPPGAGAG